MCARYYRSKGQSLSSKPRENGWFPERVPIFKVGYGPEVAPPVAVKVQGRAVEGR